MSVPKLYMGWGSLGKGYVTIKTENVLSHLAVDIRSLSVMRVSKQKEFPGACYDSITVRPYIVLVSPRQCQCDRGAYFTIRARLD